LNSVRTLIFNARIQLEVIMNQTDLTMPQSTQSETALPGGWNFAVGHAYTVNGELRDVETNGSPVETPRHRRRQKSSNKAQMMQNHSTTD
jgi:hypothetical protein